MVHSSSDKPPQGLKRKKPRTKATLTALQLARKRENDRKAQSTHRARNKERINHLECELEDLKSKQNPDAMVQTLLRENQALRMELMQLKEKVGSSVAVSPCSAPNTTFPVAVLESMLSRQHHGTPATFSTNENTLGTGNGALFSPPSPYTLPEVGSSILEHEQQSSLLPSENLVQWASNDPFIVYSNTPKPYFFNHSPNYIPTNLPTSWPQDEM